jgi:hypothetical protein
MRSKIVLGAVIAVVLVIQFIPVNRTNPKVEGEVVTPDTVHAILAKACYDCHSNQTEWPWYTYVAPVSWWVSDHVTEGREHLNFSTWSQYDDEKQIEKLDEIWDEVEEGKMPLKNYVRLHSEARLSDQDRSVLHRWTMDERAVLEQVPSDSMPMEMP